MELFSPKLIDEGRLATLTQIYLELRLPLHAARNAAGADLANLVTIQEETVSISERSSGRHSVSPPWEGVRYPGSAHIRLEYLLRSAVELLL